MTINVHNKPLIHSGSAMKSIRLPLARTNPPNKLPAEAVEASSEQRVNLIIIYLWTKGTGFIIDIHIVAMKDVLLLEKTLEKSCN